MPDMQHAGVQPKAPSASPALRVGLDLVRVEEVEQALESHGAHYLRRIYTPQERLQAGGSAARLAGIFAIKEAVVKTITQDDDTWAWKMIEVQRQRDGGYEVELTSGALLSARRQRLRLLAVATSGTAVLRLGMAIAKQEL